MPWKEPSSVAGVLQLGLRSAGLLDRLAERHARREVERQGHRRELALVVDRERLDLGGEMRERAERDLRAVRRPAT